jgi:hypothetical protein
MLYALEEMAFLMLCIGERVSEVCHPRRKADCKSARGERIRNKLSVKTQIVD